MTCASAGGCPTPRLKAPERPAIVRGSRGPGRLWTVGNFRRGRHPRQCHQTGVRYVPVQESWGHLRLRCITGNDYLHLQITGTLLQIMLYMYILYLYIYLCIYNKSQIMPYYRYIYICISTYLSIYVSIDLYISI